VALREDCKRHVVVVVFRVRTPHQLGRLVTDAIGVAVAAVAIAAVVFAASAVAAEAIFQPLLCGERCKLTVLGRVADAARALRALFVAKSTLSVAPETETGRRRTVRGAWLAMTRAARG
jgi:hypothetical protein